MWKPWDRIPRALWLSLTLSQILSVLECGAEEKTAAVSIPPPPNDNRSDALEVVGPPFRLETDLAGATSESFEHPSEFWIRHTAWWRWTATKDGIVEWDASGSSHPVWISVYEESAAGQITNVAQTPMRGDAVTLVPAPASSFQASQGHRYLIGLDLAAARYIPFLNLGVGLDGGFHPITNARPVQVTFDLSTKPPPANDSFASRTVLSGSNVLFSAQLGGATAEQNEPKLAPQAMHRTAWWTWESPGPGTARLQFSRTNDLPLVGIFQGTAPDPLTLLASSVTEYGNECWRETAGRASLEWDVVAGGRYEIQIDRVDRTDVAQPIDLSLEYHPAPPNDLPLEAYPLEGSEVSMMAGNIGATKHAEEPTIPNASGKRSVWYRWTAPTSGVVQISSSTPIRFDDPSEEATQVTGLNITATVIPCAAGFRDLHPLVPFAPVFGLFGSSSSSAVLVPGPSELLSYGTNYLISEVIGGNPYWIELDGIEGSSGTTPLNLLLIARPTNDDYSNRIVLASEAVRVRGRTFGATQEPGDPILLSPENEVLKRSVWWQWEAKRAGRWTLFITGGQVTNDFALFRGTSPSPATQVAHTLAAPIVFHAETGETFQIGVFGGGRFGANVSFTLTPVAPPLIRMGYVLPSWDGFAQSGWIQVADNSGLPYVIDRSEDFRLWTAILTNAFPWSNSVPFQSSSASEQEFFRVRLIDE